MVVGTVVEGGVFEYEGRQGEWLEINMFSGECRRPMRRLPCSPADALANIPTGGADSVGDPLRRFAPWPGVGSSTALS